MTNARTIKDRNLYKLLLTIIKYMPIIMAMLFVLGIICNVFGVSSFIISCICGTSIFTLVLLYLLSYVFRFCYLYRLPLYYVTISNILIILYKFKIIISILFVIRLLALVLGLFLIIYIIYWYKNRNKPKVDPIKDFCVRYCEYC